jgi:hypothetical protein
MWTASAIDVKVKRVCSATCNNGWMRKVDAAIEPTIAAMIQGHALCLLPDGARLLATWAAKTQLLFQYAESPPRPAGRERRDSLFKHRQAAGGTYIWLASHGGFGRGIWIRTHALEMVRPSRPSEVMNGELFTISIGHAVFQVFVGPDEVRDSFQVGVPDQVRPWVQPLWPDPGHVKWPPVLALDDPGLETYSTSFING